MVSEEAKFLEQLEEFDPPLAAALRKCETAVTQAETASDPDSARRWFGTDLLRVFDPTARWAAKLREPSEWIRKLELWRNVLVLAPITATWIGLERAARIYAHCVDTVGGIKGDALGRQPFLLLWQLGFERQKIDGRGVTCEITPDIQGLDEIVDRAVELIPLHSFGSVILLDIALLLLILGFTYVSHRWLHLTFVARTERARELEFQLRLRLVDLQGRVRRIQPAEDMKNLAEQTSHAMLRVVADFKIASAEMSSTLQAEVREQQSTIRHAVDSAAAAVQEVTATLTTSANDVTSTVRAELQETRGVLREITATTADATRQTVADFATRAREVSDLMQIDSRALSTTLATMNTRLTDVTAGLERAGNSVSDGARRLAESGEGLTARAAGIAEALGQARERLEELTQIARTLATAVPERVREVEVRADGIQVEVRTLARALVEAQRATDVAAARTHEVLSTVAEHAARSADTGVEEARRLEELGQVLTQASEKTHAVLTEVSERIEGLRAEGRSALTLGATLGRQISGLRDDVRGASGSRPVAGPVMAWLSQLEDDLARLPGARDRRVLAGAELLTLVAPPLALVLSLVIGH